MANYVKQTWTDNVTPVDKSHMDTIENGIFAAVPAVGVAAAAANVVQNLLAGADAQPAFRVLGDGLHQWGPGGATVPDTTLGRTTVGRLQLNGTGFWMNGGAFRALSAAASDGFNYRPTTAGGALIDSQVGAEGFSRFWIDASGKLSWGTGAGAQDTTLQRTAVNTLTVANTLKAVQDVYAQDGGATQVRIGNSSGNASLAFGSALDTILYRLAAGFLQTDGQIRAVTGFRANPTASGTGYTYAPAVMAGSIGYYSILLGDAQPRFYIGGDGAQVWGPGGSTAADTNLYRIAAGQLQTDGSLGVSKSVIVGTTVGPGLYYGPPGAGGNMLVSQVSGEANARFVTQFQGTMQWGPGGAAAVDTNLYRSAVGTLKTDTALRVGQLVSSYDGTVNQVALSWNGTGVAPAITFGNANDTTLYRSAAAELATDGAFNLTGAGGAGQRLYIYKLTNTRYGLALGSADFRIFYASNGVLTFGTMSTTDGTTYTELERIDAAGKHWFGAALDTNLFRFAADFLGTNDDFVARQGNAGQISLQSMAGVPYIFFGSAQDTNLYRGGTGKLQTDGSFTVGGDHYDMGLLAVDFAGAGAKMYFGSALDTNLYRSAANVLQTDDTFIAAGGTSVAAIYSNLWAPLWVYSIINTQAFLAGMSRMARVIIPNAIKTVQIEVTTGGATNFRVGIYTDTPTGPGTLLYQTADMSGATAATVTAALAVPAGVYWMAVQNVGAITANLRVVSSPNPMLPGSDAVGTNNAGNSCWTYQGLGTTLPTPAPAPTTHLGAFPTVFVQAT